MKDRKPHCGTVTVRTPEIRAAISEAHSLAISGPASIRPETADEIAQALTNYLIHPAFFTGTAAELAREYLDVIWHLDATENTPLWARYTAVAVRSLGLPGLVPVPVVNPNGHGES